MPRGPTITPRVKQLIAQISYENPELTAKELQSEVNSVVRKEKLNSNTNWPGLSSIQKELNRLRKSPNPQDTAWSVHTLSKCEIPPEALPAVLKVWVDTRLNSSHVLTIREARWVARLYCVIKDISQLAKIGRFYATYEYFVERYGPKHAVSLADHELFEIITGQKLSDEQIEKLYDENQKSWLRKLHYIENRKKVNR